MLVRLVDEPPDLRLYSEQIEIVACDGIAIHTFDRVTPAQWRLSKSIKAGHPGEGGISLPEVLKRRVRRSQQFEARPRLKTKLVEILRIAHIKRTQHDCIDYSEDDDVRSNAEHQSD